MKLSLQKKGTSTAAMLVAASITCIGLAPQAEAGVTWLASDDGTNLTLTTDGGSFDAGLSFNSTSLPANQGYFNSDSTRVYVVTDSYRQAMAGAASGSDPWVSATVDVSTGVTGDSFGFADGVLLWDPSFGDTPGVFTPSSSVTFAGLTVATAFGSNLDSGPVLLWTHGTTNDTISIALAAPVPEPSSSALLGLGGLALMLRRRR